MGQLYRGADRSVLSAIVLTGEGAPDARDDKAEAWWAGCRAIDWCVQCALVSEARAVVTVGGRGYGFAFVPDPDPASPLAGVLTAIEMLKAAECDSTLIMTIDAPAILPSDLQPLLLRRGGARFKGLRLPMLVPFGAIPEEAAAAWTLEQLAEEAGLAIVEPPRASRLRLKGDYTAEEREAVIAAMPR
jgi:molybdopterin-guanine dinucleotide biosynthesis protein A